MRKQKKCGWEPYTWVCLCRKKTLSVAQCTEWRNQNKKGKRVADPGFLRHKSYKIQGFSRPFHLIIQGQFNALLPILVKRLVSSILWSPQLMILHKWITGDANCFWMLLIVSSSSLIFFSFTSSLKYTSLNLVNIIRRYNSSSPF